MMIPFDDEKEAHYVCALANSSPFRLAVAAYSINIQQDPHVFQNVRIPKYLPTNSTHKRVANLSERAHEAVTEGELGELLRSEVLKRDALEGERAEAAAKLVRAHGAEVLLPDALDLASFRRAVADLKAREQARIDPALIAAYTVS